VWNVREDDFLLMTFTSLVDLTECDQLILHLKYSHLHCDICVIEGVVGLTLSDTDESLTLFPFFKNFTYYSAPFMKFRKKNMKRAVGYSSSTKNIQRSITSNDNHSITMLVTVITNHTYNHLMIHTVNSLCEFDTVQNTILHTVARHSLHSSNEFLCEASCRPCGVSNTPCID